MSDWLPTNVPPILAPAQSECLLQSAQDEPMPAGASTEQEKSAPSTHAQTKLNVPAVSKVCAEENDDDVIVVDFLDGTMSSQTDSILSLPPIGGGALVWAKLRTAPRPKHLRGASFGGREMSKMIEARSKGNKEQNRIDPPRLEPVRERLPDVLPRPLGPIARAQRRKPAPDIVIDMDVDSVTHAVAPHAIAPHPQPSVGPAHRHSRKPSRVTDYGDDDTESLGDSSWSGKASSAKGSRKKKGKRRRKSAQRSEDHQFRPSAWEWRYPGAEDSIMPSLAWVYLALIGWLTFFTAFSVNLAERFLRHGILIPVVTFVKARFGFPTGAIALILVRSAYILFSFTIVIFLAPEFSIGSGIPEMKCVLSGVFMPKALSIKTLVAKMGGLSFALASGISIGRLGPFIHMSGIIAAVVSRIPLFKSLQSNAIFQLQALSAAMAAGVGATFGAPIGGAMLSIELMSTYYYIHWLPMALYCSIMGYYLVAAFIETESHTFFYARFNIVLQDQSFYRMLTYFVLGGICGVIGAALVQFTMLMNRERRRWFSQEKQQRIVILLISFVTVHTLITSFFGGVLANVQKQGVLALFNQPGGTGDYFWLSDGLEVFETSSWGASLALFLILAIKFVLTGVSLALPIPAGTFMPIFEIGAILGRCFGEFLQGVSFISWVDPRATAIVGAASLTAGTLHITSIAVVMLELTREAVNVLPITVGVIVAYAVSKSLCSDLFSELIKLRRLPFILGLRERYPQETRNFHEKVASIVAGSFMNEEFLFVTKQTTIAELRAMLESSSPTTFAFLNNSKERRLLGTVKRQVLETVLQDTNQIGYGTFLEARDEPIAFLREFNVNEGHPFVDMGPMQVPVHTPYWKIITYFRMLGMNVIYVTDSNGKTVGCVTKQLVIRHSRDLEQKAAGKAKQERQIAEQNERDEAERLAHYERSQRISHPMARKMSQQNLAGMDRGRRSQNASLTLPRSR